MSRCTPCAAAGTARSPGEFAEADLRGEPPQYLVDLVTKPVRLAVGLQAGDQPIDRDRRQGRRTHRAAEASMIAAFAIVSSSGASRMFKKSY
jgi:hypothetical protein